MTPPTIDKSAWGEGPWQHEPDSRFWIDSATLLLCILLRNPAYGHWCGYIEVGSLSRKWRIETCDVETSPLWTLETAAIDGITWSDSGFPLGHHAATPPLPKDPWLIGVAYGPWGTDLSPAMIGEMEMMKLSDSFNRFAAILRGSPWAKKLFEGSYKDIDYCSRDLTSLAAQIHMRELESKLTER